jgi:hypothetical protein
MIESIKRSGTSSVRTITDDLKSPRHYRASGGLWAPHRLAGAFSIACLKRKSIGELFKHAFPRSPGGRKNCALGTHDFSLEVASPNEISKCNAASQRRR